MRRLRVHMDGVYAANVTLSDHGALAFEYAESYAARRGVTPVSLSMPVAAGRFGNRATFRFLTGLLPDSDEVRAQWASHFGVSGNSPFGLLEHVGADVAGALQLTRAGDPSTDAGTEGGFTPLSEDELARLVRDMKVRAGTWGGSHPWHWSLGGSQSKVALHRDPVSGQWGIPVGSTPTTHVVKTEIPRFPGHVVNEFVCMRAAGEVGLPVADTDMWDVPRAERVLVSRRYDRVLTADGRWRRLHQEDMVQALGADPGRKYQETGGPGVPTIVQLLRSAGSIEDQQRSVRLFLRGLLFNALIDGTDAHARNYSLLLRGDRVVLAPLYDLASYAPYEPSSGEPPQMPLPLWINGKKSSRLVTLQDWVAVGDTCGIPEDETVAIVQDVVARTPDAFAHARAQAVASGIPDRDATQVVDAIVRVSGASPFSRPVHGSRARPQSVAASPRDPDGQRKAPSPATATGRCGKVTTSGGACRRRGRCPYHG